MNKCYRLGIDIGSTTVKIAVLDDEITFYSPIMNGILPTFRRHLLTC